MTVKLTKPTVRHLVEFDDLKFWMRPQSIRDRIEAARIIKESELFEMDLAQVILVDVIIVLCIDSWEGIEIEGQPAECNFENKITFAAQRPDVAIRLRLEYQKVLESAEGNLENLPDGSKMTNGQESAKTAPEVQPMKDEPQDATNAR
jgi:hypothetical protein